MAGDDFRVEARPTLVGRGSGTTPERIADLQRQAEQSEKLHRAKPTKPFAEVMAKGRKAAPEPQLSEKEKRRQALPKSGPRLSLVHPSQRGVYGREEEAEEAVVLKG